MKLTEFLSQQAVKAGVAIDMTAEPNKAFFDAAAALTVELPDDIAKGLDSKFITVEAAKNNHPDIKNHYQTQALDTIDKSTIATWKELGVPQDVIDDMMKEGSTFKRIPLAFKKIQELENRKANASKPDQQAIQKQIDDLQASLRAEKETTARTLAEKAQFEKDMRLKYRLNSMFSSAKTVYDTLDPEEKFGTLEIVLQRALQDSNAKMDLDENGNIVLHKKDGMTYFGDNNVPIGPQQFVDQLLSRKKLLISSTPATPGTPPGGGANNPGPGNAPASGNGGNGGGAKISPLYNQHTQEALKELKDGAKVM